MFAVTFTSFAEKAAGAGEEPDAAAPVNECAFMSPDSVRKPEAPLSRAMNLVCVRSLKKPVMRPMGDAGNFWEWDYMTGDWGGARSWLWDNGVEIAYAHYFDFYANAGGRNDAFFSGNPAGASDGASFFNVGVLSLDFYFDRMGLWKNGFIHITTAATNGSSMEYQHTGTLNPNSYYSNGFADYFKLFEFFYEHKFDQNRIAVRVGQIYPYVLAGSCGASCMLQNGSFQYPTFLGTTRSAGYGSGLGPAFIGTTIGAQLRYMPNSRWTFIGHIMDGYSDPSGGYARGNEHGITPTLSMDEGVEIIMQASYRNAANPLYPGVFTAGMQLHTGTFAHRYENEAGLPLASKGGQPKRLNGNYEVFLIAEQTLWNGGPDKSAATVFAKLAAAPGDRNLVSLQTAWGISISGVVPGRPQDALTAGYSHTQFSDDYRKSLLAAGLDATHESVAELTYTANIAPWFMLRPTVQWIMNPFGADTGSDPVVIGCIAGFGL